MAKIKIKKSDGSWIDMPIVAVSGGGGTATEVSYNAVTKAMGAAFVFSNERPTETTKVIEGQSYPVVWINNGAAVQAIPVLPNVPSFNPVDKSVTIPTSTGVQYLMNNVPTEAGKYTISVPEGDSKVVSVLAQALPGYVISTENLWSYIFGGGVAPLELIAKDDFSDMAPGAPLVDSATGTTIVGGRKGRKFTQTGTKELYWEGPAAAGVNNLTKAAGGEAYIEATVQNFQWVNVGEEDYTVDIEVVALGQGSSETKSERESGGLTVRCGCSNSYTPTSTGTEMSIAVNNDSKNMTVGTNKAFMRGPQIITYTETRFPTTGIFTFKKKGKIVSYTSPWNETYTWNCESDATEWGTRFYFNSQTGLKNKLQIKSISIYKGVR